MNESEAVEDLLRRTYLVMADRPDPDIGALPTAGPGPEAAPGRRLRRHGVLVTVGVLVAASIGVGAVLVGTRSEPVKKTTALANHRAKRPATRPAATPGVVTVPDDTSQCSPTTVPSNAGEPVTAPTATGTEVAHGTLDGQNWELMSATGQSGANALEDGGLLLDGHLYGLCPGYPNPAEMEMFNLGPEAIVAGVVGYPGLAKVDLSETTVGTFDVGPSLPSPSVQVVDGVSFFIGTLPKSACSYRGLELNTTSPGVSAEHNLGFGPCPSTGLVPISASQGIWQMPPGQFQKTFNDVGTGTSPATNSNCSPTSANPGVPATTLTATGTEVAHGTLDGQAWSLWSAKGQSGANGIEDGGLVLGGLAYGLCPGYPNPAEMELIDAGPEAIVAGVVGYPGLATVDLSESTAGTFDVGQALPAPSVQVVDGVSFFIGTLPQSACDYSALELNTTSPGVSAEHNLGFGSCVANQLVPITASQGVWQLPPGQFQTSF